MVAGRQHARDQTEFAVESNFGKKFALNLKERKKRQANLAFETKKPDNDENPIAVQCILANYWREINRVPCGIK